MPYERSPHFNGVRYSVWKAWFEILIRKIRWSVTDRHSPRIAAQHAGRSIDDIMRRWEVAHLEHLSMEFLQGLTVRDLEAIFAQFMRLAVAIFKSSVVWRDDKADRFAENVEHSLNIALALTPEELRSRLKLPAIVETRSLPAVPSPFPKMEWRRAALPAKWLPDQLRILTGLWMFGSAQAVASRGHEEMVTSLLKWQTSWNHTLGSREYLAKLTPKQAGDLDFFVTLALFNAVKVKIVQGGANGGVEGGLNEAHEYLLHFGIGTLLEKLDCPPPLPEYSQAGTSEHVLGSQPRIAQRIARTVYGVDPAEWQRRRFGL
ncbi:hypothetical protein BMF94_3975 [Rhodotorula taiwanensis]|uniref:Uncharacterized protein n=1 Tax=Rhodotorula taiwanensis TaxID=741276 RepID=A0A2S5B896_9BASI|nr:hypothetical protein BMF94_3975 [Rhodotorula taiwanensis]